MNVFTLYSPNSVDTVLLSAVMARTRLAGTLDAIDVSAPRSDRAVVISDVRVAFGQHGTAKYDFHRRVNWAQLQLFRSLGMDQYLPFFSRERRSLATTFEFFIKRDDHRDDENGQIRAGVKRSAVALDEDNDQGSASGASHAADSEGTKAASEAGADEAEGEEGEEDEDEDDLSASHLQAAADGAEDRRAALLEGVRVRAEQARKREAELAAIKEEAARVAEVKRRELEQ